MSTTSTRRCCDITDGGAPIGTKLIEPCCSTRETTKLNAYRILILLMTFLSYTCYHMSRKPISVVKTKLVNCTGGDGEEMDTCTSFIEEIDGAPLKKARSLESSLDYSYLFSYAFFMFVSGFVAERVDLRYFLSAGMILSGVFTMLFGLAYYWGITHLGYFLFIQICLGAFESTGWPSVVTIVANWFGKGRRGLIFGIWNSHTSIGNILGSLLAGMFVEESWGLSFIVPGAIIAGVGVIYFFFLIPKPELVGLEADTPPDDSVVSNARSRLENPQDQTEHQPLLQAEEIDDEIQFAGMEGDTASTSSKTASDEGQKTDGYNRSHSQNSNPEPPHHHRHIHSSATIASRLVAIEDLSVSDDESHAITFLGALKIPGVVEFALCLFFAKLVSYTFLYWLPTFIQETGEEVNAEDAAYLSTLFDIGGIFGGILAGFVSDTTGKSASTCAVMLIGAIPTLFIYQSFGSSCPLNMDVSNNCKSGNIGLLMLLGLFVNGPYALITTAVSAELGTHPSLRGSAKALATVTSIIDGTGSIGAALGPFMAGSLTTLDSIFYMLMAADVMALLLLTRLVKHDIEKIIESYRTRRANRMHES